MRVQFRRLWPRRPPDGSLPLGLSSDDEGLCLAGRCRLVVAALDPAGLRFYRAREVDEVSALLSAGYGVPVDAAAIHPALQGIAGHMTRGDWTRASIAALHMGLPELADRAAAVRVLETDALLKWNPALHPRWPAGVDGGGRFRSNGGAEGDLLIPVSASTPEADRATLPKGQYRGDLKDLLERIANARPEDVPALRREIEEKYTRVGDSTGAMALHRALGDAVEAGPNLAVRQKILEGISAFARGNPEDVGAFREVLAQFILEARGLGSRPSERVAPKPPNEELPPQSREPIPPPELPSQAPTASLDIYQWGRKVSDALGDALRRADAATITAIREAADAATWLKREFPNILSSFDRPRSYGELQASAQEPPEDGYENHHIVGQGSYNSYLDQSKIKDPSNVVRIPEYKHREINKYYQSPDDDELKGLTPRQYLDGKSFEEQFEFGLRALRRFGVMQ